MRRVIEVMKGGRSAGVSRWVGGGTIFVDDVARLRLGVWRVVASEGWRWTEVGPGLGARGWRASTREHFSAARCRPRLIAAVYLCLLSPAPLPPPPRPAPPARGLAHNGVCVDGNSSVAESVGIGPPMPLCTPPVNCPCAHFLLFRRRTNDARVPTQSSHRGGGEPGTVTEGERGRRRRGLEGGSGVGLWGE